MVVDLPDGAMLERTSASEWLVWDPAPAGGGSVALRAIVSHKRLDFWQAWNPQAVVSGPKASGATAIEALTDLCGDEPWVADGGWLIDTQALEPYRGDGPSKNRRAPSR
jgi:hypothetical protein